MHIRPLCHLSGDPIGALAYASTAWLGGQIERKADAWVKGLIRSVRGGASPSCRSPKVPWASWLGPGFFRTTRGTSLRRRLPPSPSPWRRRRLAGPPVPLSNSLAIYRLRRAPQNLGRAPAGTVVKGINKTHRQNLLARPRGGGSVTLFFCAPPWSPRTQKSPITARSRGM